MSSLNIVLLLIGSLTLSKKSAELITSIKEHNKEKIKVALFFMLLTIAVIILLFLLINNKN